MAKPSGTRAPRAGGAGGDFTDEQLRAQAAAEAAPSPQATDILDEMDDIGERQPIAKIHRLNTMGQWAHLDTLGAAGIDETLIKEKYGGGQYRVYIYGTRADKSYGYLKGQSKVYTIDDSIPFKGSLIGRKEPAQLVLDPDGTPAGPRKPSTAESIMDMGLMQMFGQMQTTSQMQMQMMQDNSKALAAMLERIATPRDAGPSPMLTILPIVGPLVMELMKTMLQRKDPVEIAQQLMTITGKPDGAHTNNVKDTLSALRELVELRDIMGGGAEVDPESRWIGMAEKIIPGAMELLTAQAKQNFPAQPAPARPAFAPVRATATVAQPAPSTAPPAAASAPPGPQPPASAPPAAGAPPAEPVTPAPPAGAPDEWTPLEPYVPQLVAFASENRDPHGVCMTVVTFAPPQMLAAIREIVGRENPAVELIARFPELAPYKIWTAQVLDEFYAELFGDEGSDDEDPDEIPDAGAPPAAPAPSTEPEPAPE